jgi:predicted SprT family Zn-dependent metalloprotease
MTSPRKNRFTTPECPDDEGYISPSASPRKGSPVKKDRKAMEAKKAFDSCKHKAAEDFLSLLDAQITDGKIAELTESTGGVKILWSKKLNSTAGRANWRRECTKFKLEDGNADKTYRHFASIELAEKVIDDEERLINVLAHEFCHLANFMVSGVKDNPHGKEFKIWYAIQLLGHSLMKGSGKLMKPIIRARKTSLAFSRRNVLVTTKHSYAIDYKYTWECISCGYEFKRHSKSIDPLRHTCGSCKSKLVQTKPAVRNNKVSEYQLFVKEHFQRVKRENGGLTHGGVMEVLGREYREKKGRVEVVVDVHANVNDDVDRKEMDEVVRALDIATLDD